MGGDVALFMLTNPNTLGLFEDGILEIADIVHQAGALLYLDGANLNALAGIVRPGDLGFDIVHVNTHKTLATPHGGGGPGRVRWEWQGTWRSFFRGGWSSRTSGSDSA